MDKISIYTTFAFAWVLCVTASDSIAVGGRNYSSAPCKDSPDVERICPLWKEAGACKFRDYMRKYCANTCDLCRPPAPPIPDIPRCAYAKHGCCWNNFTSAKGRVEEGLTASQCPPCLDRQSKRFCTDWKDLCNSRIKGQGDVLRVRCPTTCGVPCTTNLNIHKRKCTDVRGYKQLCLQWFSDGKCKTDQKKMRMYCPRSCSFCQDDSAWFQFVSSN